MKLVYLLMLSILCIGCANSRYEQYKPNHIGVKTSMEWQIMEGCKTAHKPKIEAGCDWNL